MEPLARTIWPSEAPVDEGRVTGELGVPPPRRRDIEELHARIAHPLAQIASTMQGILARLEPGSGRPISLPNGANADANGNGLIVYDGPRPGSIWRVELIVVSVTGASGGASVEAYNDGPTVDEANIVGFLSGLNGANPSRGFLAPETPAVVFGGNPFLVRVLGAVANAQITCRIQGRAEQIGGD